MGCLYMSTRGCNKKVTSSEAIIKGIADDGGLYVPCDMPDIGCNLQDMLEFDYKDIACLILGKFLTDFTEKEIKECTDKAYDKKFDTLEISPMKRFENFYFLELFHGPTLAFKDMALSILPHLMTKAAKKIGIENDIVILAATSGDTGKAALEGFTDIDGTKVIVFFPEDGVSKIQKLQMTTHIGRNTHVIGIHGNFDDAQNGVKQIFNDVDMKRALEKGNYMLSSANSINIGRLIPQIVYYFYSYILACRDGGINVGDSTNFAVPTGNFGNMLAAYYAKKMGLPINKLICASNTNNVLYDFLNTGTYDRRRNFETTMSPSMDILISSNLERLLYDIAGGDSSMVRCLMDKLTSKGIYDITPDMKMKLSGFHGEYATDEFTAASIKEVFEKYDYLIDPHTAVAYSAYKQYISKTKDNIKTIIVSTASPYKFPHDVLSSLDKIYEDMDDFELIKSMSSILKNDVPPAVRNIENRPLKHKLTCNKNEMKHTVEMLLRIDR